MRQHVVDRTSGLIPGERAVAGTRNGSGAAEAATGHPLGLIHEAGCTRDRASRLASKDARRSSSAESTGSLADERGERTTGGNVFQERPTERRVCDRTSGVPVDLGRLSEGSGADGMLLAEHRDDVEP